MADAGQPVPAGIVLAAVLQRGLQQPTGLGPAPALHQEAAGLDQHNRILGRGRGGGPIEVQRLVLAVPGQRLARQLQLIIGLQRLQRPAALGRRLAIGFQHQEHVAPDDLVGDVRLVLGPRPTGVRKRDALVAWEIVDAVMAAGEHLGRRAQGRLHVGIGQEDVVAGEGGVQRHRRDSGQDLQVRAAVTGQ